MAIFKGGATSAVFALHLPDVTISVVDTNAERIASWNSDDLPFSEPGLHDIILAIRGDPHNNRVLDKNGFQEHNRRNNLLFTTEVELEIGQADLIIVAVDTPKGRKDSQGRTGPDLTSFMAVIDKIGNMADRDFILVNKSTVPCGMAEETKRILASTVRPGIQVEVLSNPEFMAEGTAIRDLISPDRVLIGSSDTVQGHAASTTLANMYASWVPRERILKMGSRSVELAKLASNALLAQRVSSINALSAICEEVGADVEEVSYACGLDHRIGSHMLQASLGFGGSCFKKDILHLSHFSARLGLDEIAEYWESIMSLNQYQTARFTANILYQVRQITPHPSVGVLGFAFKPATSDTRESPAIPVISTLLLHGYYVRIFDPLVPQSKILQDLRGRMANSEHLIATQVTVCSNVYEACIDMQFLIILNAWDQMRSFSVSEPDLKPHRNGAPEVSFPPVNGKPESEWNIIQFCWNFSHGLQMLTIVDGDSEISHQGPLNWQKIYMLMRPPRHIFDGHNFVDRRIESLGFKLTGIGRRAAFKEMAMGIFESHN